MVVVRKLWLYGLSIEARVSGQSCILVFYIFGVNVLVHTFLVPRLVTQVIESMCWGSSFFRQTVLIVRSAGFY